jgi:hypothetical protein
MRKAIANLARDVQETRKVGRNQPKSITRVDAGTEIA